jgi:hypothetical protein
MSFLMELPDGFSTMVGDLEELPQWCRTARAIDVGALVGADKAQMESKGGRHTSQVISKTQTVLDGLRVLVQACPR